LSEQHAAGREVTASSFRDPAGGVFRYRERILRVVNPLGQSDLNAFLESKAGKKALADGKVAGSRILTESETAELIKDREIAGLYAAHRGQMLVEHDAISFPSYPYEWPPEMLHAAAKLTIELALDLLPDGIGVKDGTPYNVLFRGPEPVFVDLLSFEKRNALDATWLPYAQFTRTFLLPLLAQKHFGVGLDITLTARRDGLEPEDVFRWLGPLQRFRPPFLGLVSMPVWLGSRHKEDDTKIYQQKLENDPEKARFILETLLKGLRRTMDRLSPRQGQASTWSTYMTFNNNYTREHFEAKQKFVEAAVKEFQPKRVLDVGCNTGHFSALAAREGASVVAADYDPVVVGNVWRHARQDKLDILPLVVNLTRPSPGVGWLNRECRSFLDRAQNHFDAVFMLAVIHHMLVSERVPLSDILALAADMTRDIVIMEFVAPEDSMFQRLTRGRDHLHKDLSVATFESAAQAHFHIVRTQHLEGTHRWLYLLRKKG